MLLLSVAIHFLVPALYSGLLYFVPQKEKPPVYRVNLVNKPVKNPQAGRPEASPKEKMAYKLKTDIGQAIYGLRKSTVEPVIGIVKEVLGFRQFSLRGLVKAAGEWNLVCTAFNLKRMHTLYHRQS